ncbi:uncharacterized protein LOC130724978 [Lotus japonicus]|uniref:uncharacterized protein LOC130724978 n=1 Tax=Lotus japonicus TaxID=34305 RepID=UPI0025842C28|nr:uncharacterized protein LOC130724978 [Lotus japonicus]
MAAIPTYSMQVFWIPRAILNRMEQIMRTFMWSKRDKKRGWHLVKWSTVKTAKEEGGLGVRDMAMANTTLLGKAGAWAPKLPIVHITDTKHRLCDVIQNGTWSLNTLYTVLPSEMQACLQKIAPTLNMTRQDKWVWRESSTGCYNVRDAYNWLSEPVIVVDGAESWRWIWKLKVPERGFGAYGNGGVIVILGQGLERGGGLEAPFFGA